MKALALLVALWSGTAAAQVAEDQNKLDKVVPARTPVFVDRSLLTDVQRGDPAPGTPPVFQSRILRPSLREQLQEYRLQVRNDGLGVQKRFAIDK